MLYELTSERVPSQTLAEAHAERNDLLQRFATQSLSVSVQKLFNERLPKIMTWIAHVESNDLVDR